jgi:Txe/YoeB family toxin of Txe-Axe toxin-antitoxin module
MDFLGGGDLDSVSLQGLAEDLGELLNPLDPEDVRLVQKGMMLYRQGMVSSLRIDHNVISAKVQDVTPVRVDLDLAFLQLSECTCPGEGICRHVLAVLFTAYAKVGSVADWVEQWREPERDRSALTRWGLDRAKDLVKANGVLKPDYERWVQSFEESFDTLVGSGKAKSPYIVAEMFGIYSRRIQAAAPLEQEWRLIYELIGNIVSFKKLAALSEELGHTEAMVKRSYLHVFHTLMDESEELVYKIGLKTLPFSFDEFIEKLKDEAFELLTCAQELEQERIYLYRHLWTDLFKKKAWREDEIEKVSARIFDRKEWENPLPLMVAGIHQHLLIGNDKQMLSLMDSMEDQRITPYMLYWIDLLTSHKEWKRVGAVIELFLQKIKGYLEYIDSYYPCSNFTRMALKAIKPYCTESGSVDLFEKALLKTLPYSFHEYEYLLFDQGQFERWSELHAFIGFHIADLPKDRIKIVEKEKPEVLLGLLHQSVQHEINLKNRSSYKVAVRHLKKLRTLYKKMKRLDEWEFFFGALLERTKRLRAFHEECRRSKLIDA